MQYGTLFFIVDGSRVNVKGNFNIVPQYRRKEPIVNPDGSLDFSKVGVAARISGDIAMPNSSSLKALADLDGVTITLSCDNGKTYNLSNSRQVAEIGLNPEDGQVSVDFVGDSLDEF